MKLGILFTVVTTSLESMQVLLFCFSPIPGWTNDEIRIC